MPVKAAPKLKATRNGSTPKGGKLVAEMLQIQDVRLDLVTFQVTIEGTSQLVVHAWSEKAKKMMLDKQLGEASKGREKRNPVEDFKASLYRLADGSGFGIPAVSLKNAAVTAANDVELQKTAMRRAFHIKGDMLKIEAPEIKTPITEEDSKYWNEIEFERKHGASMRSDMVRVGMGTSDIRFRAQFPTWRVKFLVEYNSRVITPGQITNLFNVAGFGVGIFEYRPECNGSWGMFRVI
jgi:hypothetical protein